MMERRRFGNTAVEVPVIGQGTWYIDRGQRQDAVEALRRGLDLGLTHIDTAEMYGGAEEIVGEAIAGRREEIYLVSKVVPQHASRQGTLQACEQSLARLRTDHLDCYLLHWPGGHPLEETLGAFEDLRQAGKIRAWGVSNFDVPHLQEALGAMGAARGAGRLACNQVLYHLQERAIEHAVLPWCERQGVAVVGYSPFGHDRFPGPADGGGPGVAGDRYGPRGDAPAGGAALPGAPPGAVHHPQSRPRGARGGERGDRRAAAHGGRPGPDRRRLSAWARAPGPANALGPQVDAKECPHGTPRRPRSGAS